MMATAVQGESTTVPVSSASVDAKPNMIDVPVLAVGYAAQLPTREIDVGPCADRSGNDDRAGEYAGLADSATELAPLVVREDPTGHCAGGTGATVWDSALVLLHWFETRQRQEARGKAGTFATANRDWARAFPSLVHDARARPLRIVELGAGIGAVGLGLARILPTAQVVLTDHTIALPLLCENTSAAYPLLEPVATGSAPCAQGQVIVRHLDFHDYFPPTTSSPRAEPPQQSSDREPPLSTLVFHPTAKWSVPRFVPDEHPIDLIVFSDLIWWAPLHEPLVATLRALTAANPHAYIAFAYERRDFEKEVPFFRALGVDHYFFNVPDAELHPQWQAPDEISVFIARRRDVAPNS
ncbi:hypothetical protein AMAG_01688 [Allomyces macrogynus ATCC 38327]|uniref:Uncharacterized protein n=1 Tax=Allomyces macrogynus (strain ATCC 38327) TaxID=578462 RepID=A0A0L0S0F3_ALLM3|nr:hypothetical protein AMAG_01688 [Allomyces macrogynus ATCC 38327]|eukprot:KNE55819.1 hypothetical protein AMAG_01688 [Allomyces macrogynus ATCC 38327]